jgi:predicted MPP superfamily phosphohydrolase
MWLAGNSGPFQLKEIELSLGLDKPIRVLHISDIHFAPGQKAKAKFLASLATLKPDLVVNTGDNLGHKDAINPCLTALEPLLSFPGVFVNGSNDYRAPKFRNPLKYFKGPSEIDRDADLDTERFTSELSGAGWLNLNNSGGLLEIAGLRLGFLGLDDPHENLDRLETLPNQKNALTDADLLIGVAHAPYLRVIEAFTKHDASVIFAGHTHGGQICLPGSKALVTNCDLPKEYAQGVSGWEFEGKQSLLNVSAGMGCSIFAPVRLFCPPSATLLTIS